MPLIIPSSSRINANNATTFPQRYVGFGPNGSSATNFNAKWNGQTTPPDIALQSDTTTVDPIWRIAPSGRQASVLLFGLYNFTWLNATGAKAVVRDYLDLRDWDTAILWARQRNAGNCNLNRLEIANAYDPDSWGAFFGSNWSRGLISLNPVAGDNMLEAPIGGVQEWGQVWTGGLYSMTAGPYAASTPMAQGFPCPPFFAAEVEVGPTGAGAWGWKCLEWGLHLRRS